MTENEKAAIAGKIWEPGIQCEAFDKWGVCECDQPDHDPVTWKHNIPAPDMSRPENWAKALEAITAWCAHKWESGDMRWVLWRGDHFVHEGTPAEALAALYDKEHPNG